MVLKTAFVDRAARLVLPTFACAGLLFVAACETLTSDTGSESAASEAVRANAGKEQQGGPAGASPASPPPGMKPAEHALPQSAPQATAAPPALPPPPWATPPGTDQVAPPNVAALPPPAETAPPEPVVNSDPKQLLGLGQGELTDLLGTPAFLRQDAPAQLWRYRGEDCRIDLFLYREPGTDPAHYVVRHYTVRSDIEPPPSADDCLKGMLIARLPKQTG